MAYSPDYPPEGGSYGGSPYGGLTDPNDRPDKIEEGMEWFWTGDHWDKRPIAAAPEPVAPGVVLPAAPLYGEPPPPAPYVPSGFGGGGGAYGGFAPSAGDVPAFNAPRWQAPPEFAYTKQFAAPNRLELENDPSFQFRLDQGRKALEQSAAGKGVLRTGGTLKDLVNYGQNFATNEYSNVYNRKFGEYKFDYDKEADTYAKNYGLQRDVFDRNYKATYDEYAPKLRGWEMNFNRDWQKYMYERDKEQQDLG